ncbi:MAG: MOSC domain-containing protein [Acidobacteriota bacterium]|nr:MOSC domain-containing protein [Acidobacteriota bacterium]
MTGKLVTIWIKSGKGQPMNPVMTARAVAGRGLLGNPHQGGTRQVTLLSVDAWRDVEKELETSLDPALRRANLLVDGLDLENSRDKIVVVGQVPILIRGETRPCKLMDEAHRGLRESLSPGWRGGAYGEVLADGELRVGDPVCWADEREAVERHRAASP